MVEYNQDVAIYGDHLVGGNIITHGSSIDLKTSGDGLMITFYVFRKITFEGIILSK
jgi:hypothetical protein